MRNVTGMNMVLSVEVLKSSEELFLQMCSIGISPRNAVILTAEKMGFDDRMRNTLYARFVGKTIEQNMIDGMTVEKAVRKALRTFDNDSEEAAQNLIRLQEIEMKRIHEKVGKDELIGIGVPGGAKDAAGNEIGAIKILGEDSHGDEVPITREELQKKVTH